MTVNIFARLFRSYQSHKSQESRKSSTDSNKKSSMDVEVTMNPGSCKQFDVDFNEECLNEHNKLRTLHGSAPLILSEEMATQAQMFADHLATINNLEDSNAEKYGENLAARNFPLNGKQASLLWYSQIKYYNFELENQLECGHFSQVIWKGTTEAGFGHSRSEDGRYFLVGHYNPPGNYTNEWIENVRPPISGVIYIPSEEHLGIASHVQLTSPQGSEINPFSEDLQDYDRDKNFIDLAKPRKESDDSILREVKNIDDILNQREDYKTFSSSQNSSFTEKNKPYVRVMDKSFFQSEDENDHNGEMMENDPRIELVDSQVRSLDSEEYKESGFSNIDDQVRLIWQRSQMVEIKIHQSDLQNNNLSTQGLQKHGKNYHLIVKKVTRRFLKPELQPIPISDEIKFYHPETDKTLKINNFEKSVIKLLDTEQLDFEDLNEFREDVFEYHNEVRKYHGANLLSRNFTLDEMAQTWANHLAKVGEPSYSNQYYNGSPIGENVALRFTIYDYLPAYLLIDKWIEAASDYDYSKEPEDAAIKKWGHFTQVIWKNTREIGIGRARCSKLSKAYVVIFYYPPGNIKHKFVENVEDELTKSKL